MFSCKEFLPIKQFREINEQIKIQSTISLAIALTFNLIVLNNTLGGYYS